jgi:hypothetical protein
MKPRQAGADAAEIAVSAEPASVHHLALTPVTFWTSTGVGRSLQLLAPEMALKDLEPPALEEFAAFRSRLPLDGVRFRSQSVGGF